MSGHKQDHSLYRWDRFSKPRVYSSSQRVTTNGDIQDWIQTVEQASDHAAAATFGESHSNRKGPRGAKMKSAAVEATLGDIHVHNAAYAEAQDLLSEWVNEKLDFGTEFSDLTDETWNKKTKADIKKEWDHLLTEPADQEETFTSGGKDSSSSESPTKYKQASPDPYGILREDDDSLVSSVIQNMLDKEVVRDNFLEDLGLDPSKPRPDPRTKMELRHQQVRENRARREQTKQQRLREQRTKKDARLEATLIVKQEESAQSIKQKREEEAIQREMANIRKEMEEERRLKTNTFKRERKKKEEFEQQLADELARQNTEEKNGMLRNKSKEDERKRKHMIAVKTLETKQEKKNIMLVQRCFSAWYGLLVERRLQLGRAKALSDWRLNLRVFNAWRALARRRHLDHETWHHEHMVQLSQRKQVLANDHYQRQLLRRCLGGWQLYVTWQQNELFEEKRDATKNKMASFLEAAASGKLWSARGQPGNLGNQSHGEGNGDGGDTTRRRVDELFGDGEHPGGSDLPPSARSHSSAGSSRCGSAQDGAGRRGARKHAPLQAWQLTRKHVQVTKQELANVQKARGDTSSRSDSSGRQRLPRSRSRSAGRPSDPGDGECAEDGGGETPTNQGEAGETPANGREAGERRPWERAPYRVNNLEHRHTAQQRVLETQQRQIRDQQRLIQDLQHFQQQQLLMQQLTAAAAAGEGQALGGPGQAKGVAHPGQAKGVGNPGQANGVGNSTTGGEGDSAVPPPVTKGVAGRGDTATSKAKSGSVAKGHVVGSGGGEVKVGQGASQRGPPRAGEDDGLTDRSDVSTVSRAPSSASTASTNTRHGEFTKRMEDRAAERLRLKKEREERKEKEEAEKLALLEAEAEQRKLKEDEEKRHRVEMYKEKKRLERQREEERHLLVERVKQQSAAAIAHHRVALIRYRGWLPWRRLVAMSKASAERAANHYTTCLLSKVLLSWQRHVQAELQEKRRLADEMHNYLLVRRAFSNWKKFGEYTAIQQTKADRMYAANLKVKVIRLWADHTAEEKVAMWRKQRHAEEHNLVRIVRTAFRAWRRFPQVARDEEERERRREDMRRKVASMIPDFEGLQPDTNMSQDLL